MILSDADSFGKKLVALDMDGTLLDGRIIQELGERLGLVQKIVTLQTNDDLYGYQRTENMAKLLQNVPETELIDAAESLGFAQNLQETLDQIKGQGHIVGIISDSYYHVARHVADKLGLDFVVANHAEVDGDGLLTGKVRMPMGWKKIGCYCKNSVCKRYCLEEAAKNFGIPIENTVAVGDTVSDSCMLERAGVGIAFAPKDSLVETKADVVIPVQDFSRILHYI